jgi:DNA-binding NarL/FixJ family response regulator
MDDFRWRVLLVDDHEVVRCGIRLLLGSLQNVDVIGEASNGNDALRLCHDLAPNLVLMDLEMPDMDGIEATKRLREELPEIAVLILTVHEDDRAVLESVRAGASGYIAKSSGTSEIAQALEALRSDLGYMSPTIADRAFRGLSKQTQANQEAAKVTESFTKRERDVLALLAEGHSAKRIGRRLGISQGTVNTHLGHIYRRLGVNNRVSAVWEAVRLGMVPPPDGRDGSASHSDMPWTTAVRTA